MRKIKIGFSRRKGFAPFSWAIMAYEQTPYSHVYFRISTKWSTELIYQASGTAVNFMAGKVFSENNKIFKEFELEITENAYDIFMCWATTVCGKPYSSLQPLGIFLMDLFNLSKNPFSNGTKAWVCSELVSFALSDIIGVEISPHIFEKASPYDLYKLCEGLENANKQTGQ